ncbi:HutD family protein [Vogesella fluminis]|uniref:HutD-family protein n=1 Tax=Vogesella fluminis TaxID=1069161 RepID=A0ABQ3HD96_9NEIS|nr:HutD family protein [Vogesella fluminis]GHD76352.1 HutD-family protein [Vogesella fluminis]
MHIVRFADCPPSPWKNGGGITRQLLIRPAAANLDDFALRVSVADIDSDGPFSRFDGIDRTLTLLEGGGLQLQRDGAPLATLHADSPLLHFVGEWPISSQRLAGKVRDFNIMTRRSQCRHRAERLSLDGSLTLAHDGPLLLLLAQGDAVTVNRDGASDTLQPFDLLWLKHAGTLQLHSDNACQLLLAHVVFAGERGDGDA